MSLNLKGMQPVIDVVAPISEQPIQRSEWPGHGSSKFNGSKAHVPEPVVDQAQAHPLYSMAGRKHFDKKQSDSQNWKPSLKTGIEPKFQEPRQTGVVKIDFKPSDVKDYHERRHLNDQKQSLQGPTLDNPKFCMRPTEVANKLSTEEYSQEKVMTTKTRVKTLIEQRNGLPMVSPGDKIYKHPDYTPGFFKEGGLITGSTNQNRTKTQPGGQGKANDFYKGLKLDQGPLNPNRKTWAEAFKEQQLNEELDAVGGLKDWERSILKDVHPNYQVSDDDDDLMSNKKPEVVPTIPPKK